jgi:epoxyqueuosine reductase
MKHYRAWLECGYHGDMGYLARPDAVDRRGDLRGTMETVRAAVVVAHPYDQPDSPGVPDDPSVGVIARYARGRDYHKVLKNKLVGLAQWLDGACPSNGPTRVYVDTGPILERELARRAGLGWFGRNTMLIHPRHGSYFFLGVLLTEAPLPPDPPFEADHCGSCTRCVEACPTDALLGRDEAGAPVLDARRCISYLTIEARSPIPSEFREAMGNRVFGCDICQEVCPWNGAKFPRLTSEPDYLPGWRNSPGRPDLPDGLAGTASPSLADLSGMTREEWDLWTLGSPLRRAGYERFQESVAVALANLGRGGK